jgi:hypothetical protein
MSHESIQEMISQFTDDALPQEELPGLFRHLSECEECREFFVHTKKIHDGMKQLIPPVVPAELDKTFSILKIGVPDRPLLERSFTLSVPSILLSVIAMSLFSIAVVLSFDPPPQSGPAREQQSFNEFQSPYSSAPLRY